MNLNNVWRYLIQVVIASSLLTLVLYKLVDIRLKRSMHMMPGVQKNAAVTQATSHLQSGAQDGRVARKNTRQLKELLTLSAQSIMETQRQIRSGKAREAMSRTIRIFKNLLKAINVEYPKFRPRRKVVNSNSTCREIFRGPTFGYPLFHTGFQIKECFNKIPKERLVTIVVTCEETYKDACASTVYKLVASLKVYNKNISVIIGIFASQNLSNAIDLGRIKILRLGRNVSQGTFLNRIVSSVRTKFILVARDLSQIDSDSNLERLIREVERLKASTAGGSIRDQYGHWRRGCHQMVHQNHTLAMEEGYTESVHECLLCDVVEGPFLIRSALIRELKFDEHIHGAGMMEDLFLRLQKRRAFSVVCPDAMFHVRRKDASGQNDDWTMFGRKWDMKRVILSSGQKIDIDCPIDYKCLFWKGFAVSVCCLEELANLVNFIMASCSEIGALCEVQEGTLLGAVKFDKVLPWERDADIAFHSSNFTSLKFLASKFKNYGYVMNATESPKYAGKNITGGKIVISSKHWHVELYGQSKMDSLLLLTYGRTPTKVMLNGHWVNGPKNPGLYVRNRYGYEVFAHSEHWMATEKKSGWEEYETNTFIPCSEPGYHNCLDRYGGDGSLQFKDPIP